MIDIHFRSKRNGVPILSRKEIDLYAEKYLADFNKELLKEPGPIAIDEFAEFYLDLQIDYQDLTPDNSVLGMCTFNDGALQVYDAKKNQEKYIEVREGTVLIDNSLLAKDQRRRGHFTCAHEAGHWIFHRKKYYKPKYQMTLFDYCDDLAVIKCRKQNIENIAQRGFLQTDDDWLEWQADNMASALLMPRTTFGMAVKEIFNTAGIKGTYILKNQDFDQYNLSKDIAYILADIFDVSVQAASIRLDVCIKLKVHHDNN